VHYHVPFATVCWRDRANSFLWCTCIARAPTAAAPRPHARTGRRHTTRTCCLPGAAIVLRRVEAGHAHQVREGLALPLHLLAPVVRHSGVEWRCGVACRRGRVMCCSVGAMVGGAS
jgi:hypothetical protein